MGYIHSFFLLCIHIEAIVSWSAQSLLGLLAKIKGSFCCLLNCLDLLARVLEYHLPLAFKYRRINSVAIGCRATYWEWEWPGLQTTSRPVAWWSRVWLFAQCCSLNIAQKLTSEGLQRTPAITKEVFETRTATKICTKKSSRWLWKLQQRHSSKKFTNKDQ